MQTQSGLSQQHNADVVFTGVTTQPNQVIDLFLRDRRGATVGTPPAETTLPVTAASSGTETSPGSGLYSFTATIPAAQLPASSWISQANDGRAQGGLRRGVGRVEIVARAHGNATNFKTYSAAALDCAGVAANQSEIVNCADGDSFLVYDDDGVGLTGAAATAADFVLQPGAPYAITPDVDMEVGTYSVPGLTPPVNAVVCRPHAGAPATGRRTVVLNHGGFLLDWGALDACVNWARAGWIAALTAYRYEPIVPDGSPVYTYPAAVARPGTSDPAELCLGEVTDTLRWLDIVRDRADTDDDQILMWGYSHGACVTLRALEQGAEVKAAVAVSSPTEFSRWEQYSANVGDPTGIHIALGGTPAAIPDAYHARSPARMAVDLQRRGDVKLLQIAVEKDTIVPVSQGCMLADAIGAENHLMLPGGDYSASTTAPNGVTFAGCQLSYITWTGGTPGWNKRAYYLLYENITPWDGHLYFGYTTPPAPGQSWDLPLNKGIRDFLLASFP
ncbi:alpha/beta hydrolase family protein [Nannocystis punicea]|uniref:Prolyl oligopeptidase family serine peptidase n=1 Tax=Nannocystis punicea TaxID=2995304 RepID=A0ABY7GY45_9BACT|nr:prolyl oligopeptidase family serine peptidase [Nannocystis poenicansa]WAS91749.1 prolyl oligopeptidase family serine peptidase [Nannocystis poenicansa]